MYLTAQFSKKLESDSWLQIIKRWSYIFIELQQTFRYTIFKTAERVKGPTRAGVVRWLEFMTKMKLFLFLSTFRYQCPRQGHVRTNCTNVGCSKYRSIWSTDENSSMGWLRFSILIHYILQFRLQYCFLLSSELLYSTISDPHHWKYCTVECYSSIMLYSNCMFHLYSKCCQYRMCCLFSIQYQYRYLWYSIPLGCWPRSYIHGCIINGYRFLGRLYGTY